MEFTDTFQRIPKKPLYELEPGVTPEKIFAIDITATNVTASQGILLQIEHLKIEGDLSTKKSDYFAEFVNKILMNPTSKLRTLGLDEVVISSKDLELLSAALVNNTTLRTLSLSANRIGDTGAFLLGLPFAKNTSWPL